MGRNFFSRVETCFPITEKRMKQRVFRETIEAYLADNSQAWELNADGSYTPKQTKQNRKSAQESLLETLAETSGS